MLFDIKPKPIPTETAPFVFDEVDSCRHDLGNECYLTADLLQTRGGWSWGASHVYIRPDVPEETEYAVERATGTGLATRVEALREAVRWMRGQIKWIGGAPDGEVKA